MGSVIKCVVGWPEVEDCIVRLTEPQRQRYITARVAAKDVSPDRDINETSITLHNRPQRHGESRREPRAGPGHALVKRGAWGSVRAEVRPDDGEGEGLTHVRRWLKAGFLDDQTAGPG
jgi:hypothetical protein